MLSAIVQILVIVLQLSTDSPDISFVYSDTDSYDAEIAGKTFSRK